MIEILIFLLGLSFGSFLNVCIHRMPRERSIIHPPSHCPSCEKEIAWYDNIPLLSFVLLGAKCRHCKSRISPRYFLIELATGLLWLALLLEFGLTWIFVSGVVLISILLAVSAIDLETGLIPDRLTLPGMVAGLIFVSISPQLLGREIWYDGLFWGFVGLLVGGGILWLTAFLGNLVFRKESMGGGDIKLLAMIGVYVGFGKAIFVFFMAPFIALPFALFMKFARKNEIIPYGPYLAVSGALVFVYGDVLLQFFGFIR